ncbi:MAG: Rid family detoxifying hydrolase [Gammaproteobacteria bacterium]|nr:Rid family detoxifying hydrolase [Gammaproteobacteria bacterium]
MTKKIIATDKAPEAIGPYSQAVQVDNVVYISGQIPLVPGSMTLVEGDMTAQVCQALDNLAAVARAADGSLNQVVKFTVYLTDLSNFPLINEIMAEYLQEPYPARAAVGVTELPKGASVEMDAVLVLDA